MNRLVGAAAAGCLSGIVLFLDLGFHLFGGLGRGYFVLATVMAFGLLGTPAALWLSGSFAPRKGRTLGLVGTVLVVAGALLWAVAFTLLLIDPSTAFTQRLTPGGSSVMALGMIICGAAVLASKQIRGWRAITPLVVGLYFPLQLLLQLTFFLSGRDDQPGPNGLLLGAWGLLWALCSYAAASPGVSRVQAPDARLQMSDPKSTGTRSHAW
jgi:hypothetical protein